MRIVCFYQNLMQRVVICVLITSVALVFGKSPSAVAQSSNHALPPTTTSAIGGPVGGGGGG